MVRGHSSGSRAAYPWVPNVGRAVLHQALGRISRIGVPNSQCPFMVCTRRALRTPWTSVRSLAAICIELGEDQSGHAACLEGLLAQTDLFELKFIRATLS